MRTSPPDEERTLEEDLRAEDRRVRVTLRALVSMIAVALVTTFIGFQVRSENLAREQTLSQARAFAIQMVAIRGFVARHGGVWVPESEAATINPYLLRVPGLQVRVQGRDGRTYVLQNPEAVTRGIDRRLGERSGATYRLTSRRPLDPSNVPDEFEASALRAFGEGARERYTYVRDGGRTQFRYVVPLPTTKDCLPCHGFQGYRTGEIRGALTVRIDASEQVAEVSRGRTLVALVLLGALATLVLATWLVVTRLVRALRRAEERLRRLASVDELTGLFNRRVGLERLSAEVERTRREGGLLACAMLDLDRFKDVNDTLGHAAGDDVLRAASSAIADRARTYDTVSRIGGEEFLVVLPGVAAQDALPVVERMRREVVRATGLALGEDAADLTVTVSAGVATYEGAGQTPEELLRRADEALYRAKETGRDRTVTAGPGA